MRHEPKQCLLLQLLPLKGGVEQGKERGPSGKFPALKRGSREVGVEGRAEVSELTSRKGRGRGLGVEGGLRLRRREGGGSVRWRLRNWIWSGCKGIGSDRGWAVVRVVEGRRKV